MEKAPTFDESLIAQFSAVQKSAIVAADEAAAWFAKLASLSSPASPPVLPDLLEQETRLGRLASQLAETCSRDIELHLQKTNPILEEMFRGTEPGTFWGDWYMVH